MSSQSTHILARTRDLRAVALVLLSAALFGALAVLAQLAYDAGVSVLGLLLGRFAVAGMVLWLIVLVLRRPLPSRRGVVTAVALGAGYSSMAFCFAASLKHLESDLADLLLFAYPVLVSIGAVLLGRERFNRRRAAALAAATAGIALALTGGGTGVIDPLGVGLALASALIYAVYVLASSSLLANTDPFVLAASVATGAAITFFVDAAIHGQLAPRGGLTGIVLASVPILELKRTRRNPPRQASPPAASGSHDHSPHDRHFEKGTNDRDPQRHQTAGGCQHPQSARPRVAAAPAGRH